MAKESLIKQFVTTSGCHGIDGGSIDNLDIYTDLVVEKAIDVAQAEFKDKNIKKRIYEAVTAHFGPKSTRR